MQLTFALIRTARRSGGDCYEAELDGKPWRVYIPQSLSRPKGTPREHITLSVDTNNPT